MVLSQLLNEYSAKKSLSGASLTWTLGKPAHPLKQLLDKMGPNFEEGPEKDVQKKTIYPKISVLKIYDCQSLA